MTEPEKPSQEEVAEKSGEAKSDAQEEEEQQKQQLDSAHGDDVPNPKEFVNNGLEKWLAAREAWCRKPTENEKDEDDESKTEETHKHAIPVDVDGIIDVLFDPRWRGGAGRGKVSLVPPRFPKNVPLPQMIDVLTDLWEAEGLDV